jgi:hypothetical protein
MTVTVARYSFLTMLPSRLTVWRNTSGLYDSLVNKFLGLNKALLANIK